jgi:hypothetical protein
LCRALKLLVEACGQTCGIKDRFRMIHRLDALNQRSQAQAREIVEASNTHLRAYVRRGIMERWLTKVVRHLNTLESQPATRDLARRALQRLGFPSA